MCTSLLYFFQVVAGAVPGHAFVYHAEPFRAVVGLVVVAADHRDLVVVLVPEVEHIAVAALALVKHMV